MAMKALSPRVLLLLLSEPLALQTKEVSNEQRETDRLIGRCCLGSNDRVCVRR